MAWMKQLDNVPEFDRSPQELEAVRLVEEALKEVDLNDLITQKPYSTQVVYAWALIIWRCASWGIQHILSEAMNIFCQSLPWFFPTPERTKHYSITKEDWRILRKGCLVRKTKIHVQHPLREVVTNAIISYMIPRLASGAHEYFSASWYERHSPSDIRAWTKLVIKKLRKR